MIAMVFHFADELVLAMECPFFLQNIASFRSRMTSLEIGTQRYRPVQYDDQRLVYSIVKEMPHLEMLKLSIGVLFDVPVGLTLIFQHMPWLRTLELYDCLRLNEGVPPRLPTSLNELKLSFHDRSASCTVVVNFEYLTALKRLDLINCAVNRLLFLPKSLTELNLTGSHLIDHANSLDLSQFTRLVKLELPLIYSTTMIQCCLPSSLTVLDIGPNCSVDLSAPRLTHLTNLTMLYAPDTGQGRINGAYCLLSHLTGLVISYANETDVNLQLPSLPDQLAQAGYKHSRKCR
jgi:hypothetical protein